MDTKKEPAAKWVDIDSIKPWGRNPKRLDESDVARMVRSIERFGWADVIVAREADGEIISGHLRHAAAKSLGMAKVPVRYLPIDSAEAHALAVAVTQHEAVRTFDESIGALLADMQEEGIDLDGLGWSEDELRDIIAAGQVEELEPEDPDDVPEVATVVHSALGEVYELGLHRLVCGDSTSPESWGALMQGEQARMVWTDPPYGVAVVGCAGVGSRATPESKRRKQGGLTIENDALSPDELESFLSDALGLALAHSKEGAAWYVASPPGPLSMVFGSLLERLGVYRQTLAWVKDSFVLGRSDYHNRFETIFYGWAPGAAHYFVDDRTQDTVHEVKRPGASKEHPTMKPVELIRRHIENSSKPGWLVAEPFGGSGSTLMACAETGRVARLIELDPKYCDVIRRRWTRYAKKNGLDAGSGALEDADVEA